MRGLIHKHFPQKRIFAILLVAFLFMVTAGETFAACQNEGGTGEITNPVCSNDFYDVLMGLAKFAYRIGIPVLTFFIVLAGIMFVVAQGNEEKIKKAKTMLYWTVMGAAIIMGAVTLATIVINFAKSLTP